MIPLQAAARFVAFAWYSEAAPGRATPEEAKLPRSNAGDRASDIYRGAVLPVNARPARPSRPVSCVRKTCGSSLWPR